MASPPRSRQTTHNPGCVGGVAPAHYLSGMSATVHYASADGVAEITLSRPDVLNSFTMPMARELQALLARSAEDAAVRAVLITGAGRAFCAGQDLAEAVPPDGSPGPPIEEIVRTSYNPLVRAIRELEKPVVCAVNGVAAGAGANLAFACDIVIAADNASFIQAFSKIGLIPDTGGTFVLPRLVGLARATALTFLGDKLSAQEAQAMGLIWRVVERDRLMDEARALAKQLAMQPTRGFALTKRALNASMTSDLEAQLELEANLQAEAGATHDFTEGVAAFMEKRAPRFEGR
jgi:2-(1,2-epoxy-1,2-dihydrophenyl)acetyl-CoA isomerase